MMRLLLRDDKDAILVPIPQYPLYSVSLSLSPPCARRLHKIHSVLLAYLCMLSVLLSELRRAPVLLSPQLSCACQRQIVFDLISVCEI